MSNAYTLAEVQCLLATRVVVTANGCREWCGARGHHGYGNLHFGGEVRAHRVAYVVARGQPIPAGTVVRHKCDNPICVNPSHLELGSPRDNVLDAVRRGRWRPPKGSAHPSAALTPGRAREARRRRARGETLRRIADRLGVSVPIIQRLCANKSYQQPSESYHA